MLVARALLSLGHRNNTQKIMLLYSDQIMFGRDASNDVRLYLAPLEESIFQTATADISRQHFKICRQDFGYTIYDLNSTNGTSINCVGITKEQPLQHNQIIDVGGVLELNVILKQDVLWLQRINNLPQESYLIFKEDGFTLGNDASNTIVVASDSHNSYKIKILYDGDNWVLINHQETPVQVNNNPIFYGNHFILSNSSDIILGNEIILFQIEKKLGPPIS